jgi:hypothetical protein
LIGLYSNVAEGPGFIRGHIPGEHQYEWFRRALSQIAEERKDGKRKALIVAMHHPPITAKLFDPTDPGHSPSEEMGRHLDEAFSGAGIWPEAVLSGHDHNFQRFTRTVQVNGANKDVCYVVAGTGGRSPQPVLKGEGQVLGHIRFDHSYSGHGYLLVTAAKEAVRIEFRPVGPDPNGEDRVVLPLT